MGSRSRDKLKAIKVIRVSLIFEISNMADTKTNFRIKRMSATKKVTKPEP